MACAIATLPLTQFMRYVGRDREFCALVSLPAWAKLRLEGKPRASIASAGGCSAAAETSDTLREAHYACPLFLTANLLAHHLGSALARLLFRAATGAAGPAYLCWPGQRRLANRGGPNARQTGQWRRGHCTSTRQKLQTG